MTAHPTRPLHVLYLTGNLGTGGSEVHVARLSTGLDPSTIRPSILLLRASPGHLLDVVREAGVPVHDLGLRAGKRRIASSMLRLRAAIRGIAPDVVHTYGYPCDVWAPLVAPRDTPVVTTRRGRQPYPRRRLMYRMTNPLCASVLCVSEAMREFAMRTDGLTRERSRVIPNGVDVGRFSARPRRGPGRVIGTHGRIAPVKGTDLLLDAFRRLGRRDLELRVAGPPAGEWGERLVASHRSTPGVTFLGDVADPASFLDDLDVYVLPSRSEGMSMALLEAMAAGLPIVATDVDSNGEVLERGRAGRLAAPDADALAAALTALLDAPDAAAELAARARRRAEREYDVRVMIRRYERFYRDLVGDDRGERHVA